MPVETIKQLAKNRLVFEQLFKGITPQQALWKPTPATWSMLEVVCHLVDEERDDFRTRVQLVLTNPTQPLPAINPVGWVQARNYQGQSFDSKAAQFITEREQSIAWLSSLTNPPWGNSHQHPTLGALSAELFLANWLAHDYIHLRQLNRLAYEYHQFTSGLDLSYAGNW